MTSSRWRSHARARGARWHRASRRARSSTHPPSPFVPCFHFGRRGVSRTAGGPDAGLGRRRLRAGARGVASDPPTDQPEALPRAGPRLRRGHSHGNDR
eukprot:4417402-Pleurochrysis_carterae.AAC.1